MIGRSKKEYMAEYRRLNRDKIRKQAREYSKKYYQAHKQERLDYNRRYKKTDRAKKLRKKYYDDNSEVMRNRAVEYYANHREERREYAKKYRMTHRKEHNEYMRKWRVRHQEDPIKAKARHAVGHAIRDGKIIKQPCSVCGTLKNIQAHHPDYNEPLEVVWLCRKHHMELHSKYKEDRV